LALFTSNNYIEAVKRQGEADERKNDHSTREGMIIFLLSGQSPEVANLWRIVKAAPYARCRSKTPPGCRGRAMPGCKGSVLLRSRVKPWVGPGRQPWPSCMSMRHTVLGTFWSLRFCENVGYVATAKIILLKGGKEKWE